MENIEIEARFLNISVDEIKNKILLHGATDLGENIFEETIFYNKDLSWRNEGKFVRLRVTSNKNVLTYKHIYSETISGAEEVELNIESPNRMKLFLEKIGLVQFRVQQKKRHSFKIDNVYLDIDQWPLIPPYLEIEGPSEVEVMRVANVIGLDWEKATFIDARKIIESYGYDVSKYTYFTFEKCE